MIIISDITLLPWVLGWALCCTSFCCNKHQRDDETVLQEVHQNGGQI